MKASIEAELATPSIAMEVKAKVDLHKESQQRSGDYTCCYWSGRGSIKDSRQDRSTNTLKMAAAVFPDLVAATLQGANAILTRYTLLKSMVFAGKFFMGTSISTDTVGTPRIFNAMDVIDIDWQIKAISFARRRHVVWIEGDLSERVRAGALSVY